MLLSNLNLLATAPGGVARLRELILTLAVQGKLLPQNPQDEPARVLLKKIRVEKDRLILEGKIKRDKPLAAIGEDEKPFEVPVGWEWVRLSELLPEFQNGASSRGDVGGRSVTVLRLADIKNRRVSLADTRQILIAERDIQKYQLIDGDILITRVNGSADIVGQFNLCNTAVDAIYCDHFIRMRVNTQWLAPTFSALLSESSLIRHRIKELFITTAGQKTVNQGHIGSLQFGLPPLAEQTRIVTRVEELMRLCDALETKGQLAAAQHAQLVSTLLGTLTDSATPDALAENWQRIASHFDLLLDRPQAVDALEQTILQLAVRGLLVPQDPTDEPARVLLQAIRTEKDRLIAAGQLKRDKPLPPITDDEQPFALPLGWEWARLANAVLKITDGEHLSPPKADQGMPLLTAKDVTANLVRFENTQFVSQENGSKYRERCDPARGDVLICSRGTIGRCAAVETDQIFCLMGSVILLKTAQQLECRYLLLHLRTDLAQTWMRGVSSATAVSALYLKDVARCLIPVPPLPEQSRIVTRVESLRRLCFELRQRLSASQTTQAQLAEALVSSCPLGTAIKFTP